MVLDGSARARLPLPRRRAARATRAHKRHPLGAVPCRRPHARAQLSYHGVFFRSKRPPIVLEQLDKPVEFKLREWRAVRPTSAAKELEWIGLSRLEWNE